MGKMTAVLPRSAAVARVAEIQEYAVSKDYHAISIACAPVDDDADELRKFVDHFVPFNPEKYSNSMLTQLMNSRFYRLNDFENIEVRDEIVSDEY